MPAPPQIRPLTAADAAALVACVRRSYGDTYPDGELYDEVAITRAIERGRLCSHVAIDASGRVIGHLGVRFDEAGDRIGTGTVGVVDPAFRRQGVMLKMGRAMFEACRERGVVGLRLYVTSAHDHTQGPVLSADADVTGVLLGHIPSGTRYDGVVVDHAARIATLVCYHPIAPAPRVEVHLPERYRELAGAVFAGVSLPRTLRVSGAAAEPLRVGVRDDPKRGVRTLRVDPRGVAIEETLARPGLPVCYADVALELETAPGILEALRGHGFHFGALIPGTGRGDVLRLQRIADAEIAPERIRPGSELGERVLSEVLRDRAAVRAGG